MASVTELYRSLASGQRGRSYIASGGVNFCEAAPNENEDGGQPQDYTLLLMSVYGAWSCRIIPRAGR